MNRDIAAAFRKEMTAELRSRTGLATSGVFAVSAVVTLSLAFFNRNPNRDGLPDVAASVLWTAGLFATLLAVPRTFLAEEEGGTMDLLRQWARPEAVYWGKVLFNLLFTILLMGFVAGLFVVLTNIQVHHPVLLVVSLIAGGAALAGTGTLCGAIAAPAANRAALAAAVAVPLMLPLMFILVSSTRVAFGSGFLEGGWRSAVGAVSFAVLTLATGPAIFAAMWKS